MDQPSSPVEEKAASQSGLLWSQDFWGKWYYIVRTVPAFTPCVSPKPPCSGRKEVL